MKTTVAKIKKVLLCQLQSLVETLAHKFQNEIYAYYFMGKRAGFFFHTSDTCPKG